MVALGGVTVGPGGGARSREGSQQRCGNGAIPGLSRRDLLVHGSFYGGGLWLALQLPLARPLRAAQASSEPLTLSPAEWKTLTAVCGRILPADHEPGAVEAGCVNFIDKALHVEEARSVPVYRAGLAGVDAVARRRFAADFAALGAARQDEVLAAVERGDAPGWPEGSVSPPVFFEVVRAHTIVGFLADPRYGGNAGFAGWRVVGYPGPRHHRGGYTPAQMLGEQAIDTVWGGEV